MGQYTKKGMLNGYKKNNKERAALDYYATPPQEVTNILEIVQPNIDGATILEPSCGEGHMIKPIIEYAKAHDQFIKIIGTDVKQRGWVEIEGDDPKIIATYDFGEAYDFLGDDYPYDQADWIIMNPPYSTIEPFVIRALEIAKKGLLMLGRLQFLEGKGRYENIFAENPPTDVYVYVDRIKCYKNGDFSNKESSAQAYGWFLWRMEEEKVLAPRLHWIRKK